MSKEQMIEIADRADMIVRGYAFTRQGEYIRIVNLNKNGHAMVISNKGKMLETNMDPIEQEIVLDIWNTDSDFMEDCDAEVLSK
jgi:hypothetical protein